MAWSLSPASGVGALSAATAAVSVLGSTSTVTFRPPAADAAVTGTTPATLTAAVTI